MASLIDCQTSDSTFSSYTAYTEAILGNFSLDGPNFPSYKSNFVQLIPLHHYRCWCFQLNLDCLMSKYFRFVALQVSMQSKVDRQHQNLIAILPTKDFVEYQTLDTDQAASLDSR